jgi:hypothetical protein
MESPVLFPIEPPSDSPATNKLLNDLHKLHKESVSKNNTPVGEELMGQSNLTKQDSKNDDDDFDLTEIDKLIEEENKKIQVRYRFTTMLEKLNYLKAFCLLCCSHTDS